MTPEASAALAAQLHELEGRGSAEQPHWSLDEFRAELESSESRVFLWREGDSGPLAGFLLYRFAGEEAWILNIAVGDKGRGLGGRLLQAFLVDLRRTLPAARKLGLEVRAANLPATALYARYGFLRVATRARYYRDGQDAHIYLLDL
jgi:ribosomal-protein-alanine N-acetyltransferase